MDDDTTKRETIDDAFGIWPALVSQTRANKQG
jgi:hypothetical protein